MLDYIKLWLIYSWNVKLHFCFHNSKFISILCDDLPLILLEENRYSSSTMAHKELPERKAQEELELQRKQMFFLVVCKVQKSHTEINYSEDFDCSK